MWWRFRKHRLALFAATVLALMYLAVTLADFLAYADPIASEAQRTLIAPQSLHMLLNGGSVELSVDALAGTRDPHTLKRVYVPDPTHQVRVHLFARGYPYRLLGLIPTDVHLFGLDQRGDLAQSALALLGTDAQGRDQWSRLMVGTRVSMLIGLASVALSLVLGVSLGGTAGYLGGRVDTVVMRLVEILRSIPTIPLWMGLAAAVPKDWDVVRVFFIMTLIFALIQWTDIARVVRGRFLALREEEFVLAAELVGCSRARIVFHHLVPSFVSYIIAATTLALPAILIFETSLSFLGLGMRPPAISWGVLLQQASNVQTVALSPWLLLPAVPVVLAILAFNFLGDGLRDAADPYGG